MRGATIRAGDAVWWPRYLRRGMGATADSPLDCVAQRRRAAALARHSRNEEGLSIAQIAERLGRAPATVKAYFYDRS